VGSRGSHGWCGEACSGEKASFQRCDECTKREEKLRLKAGEGKGGSRGPRLSSGSTSRGRCSINFGLKEALKTEGEGESAKGRAGMVRRCRITAIRESNTVEGDEK